jgi:hypothetical protein
MRAPPSPLSGFRNSPLQSPTIQKALRVLLEGYDNARDLQTSPWEFAVERTALLADGCTPHGLRWLARRGYVEQAEAAAPRPRRARAGGAPPEASHFVLTDAGAAVARAAPPLPPPLAVRAAPSAGGRTAERELPVWDNARGELHFRGRLVRRFRNTASQQRAVLDAFQREGWPERLPDPLARPAGPCVNRKQRLHDVIKNLNRRHGARRLRFYGTDCGRAVGWRWLG